MEEVVQRDDKSKPESVSWDDDKNKDQKKAHKLEEVIQTEHTRMQAPDG